MTFEAKDLIFVIDVTTNDHDVADFEVHYGAEIFRANAITCGKTNPRGRLPGFEEKEYAVRMRNQDDLRSLRDALLLMVNKLDNIELEASSVADAKDSGKPPKKRRQAAGPKK